MGLQAVVVEGAEGLDNRSEVDRLCALLRDQFSSPSWKAPMLPAVAMEVLRLSQSTDSGIEEIVLLLERDALLAGRVLRLAQSPFYASGAGITTMMQAAVRLGVTQLRNLVLEVAISGRIFRQGGYQQLLSQVHHHALAVAYVSQTVARRWKTDPDFAFLLGIFHDVGCAAALTLLGATKPTPALDAVLPTVYRVHDDAGAVLARLWQLPEALCAAIPRHHHISTDPALCTLAIAEHLVDSVGGGASDPSGGVGAERLDVALHTLKVEPAALERLREDCGRIVALATTSDAG